MLRVLKNEIKIPKIMESPAAMDVVLKTLVLISLEIFIFSSLSDFADHMIY